MESVQETPLSEINAHQVALIDEPALEDRPPAAARWLLFLLLAATLLLVQILVAIPVLLVLTASNRVSNQAQLETFITSEPGLLLVIIAAAVAGIGVVLAALVWSPVWNFFSESRKFRVSNWLAWYKPEHLRLWHIPLITIPLLLGLGLGVGVIFGDSVVEAQLQLFSTPLLQVISSFTVIFIAPISEEIVFRGGLYNALLRTSRGDEPPWLRHILPYLITSLAFAALHLSAGFERLGSIVLITVFSFYLTALRSYTGSIKTSFIAHLSWNALAALGLIAQHFLNLS